MARQVLHTAKSPLTAKQTSSIQQLLGYLRMGGYASVQFNALLVPLLVFQLTGSAAFAGLAMAVEGVPKLLMYLMGGSFIRRLSPTNAHIGLEVIRLLSLGVLLLAALGFGNMASVGLAAACFQCANAVSNIIFETSVTRWWGEAWRTQGHAFMLQRDQLGCVIALLLGIATGSAFWVAICAVVCQGALLLALLSQISSLYPKNEAMSESSAREGNVLAHVKEDIVIACNRHLVRFAALTLLLGVPSALIFSALIYLLKATSPDIEDPARWISAILLARAVLATFVLEAVQQLLRRAPAKESLLTRFGLLLMLGATPVVTFAHDLVSLLSAVAVLATSGLFFLPWVRAQRQELLTKWVPAQSTHGVTGILSSAEASSYLVSAALLVVFSKNLSYAVYASFGLALVGATLAWPQLSRVQRTH